MGKVLKAGFLAILLSSTTTTAFAKTVNFKDAGVALYIFLIVGGVIVLLQLIPAAFLFLSFTGTTIGLFGKKSTVLEEKKTDEEKVSMPAYRPAPAEKMN